MKEADVKEWVAQYLGEFLAISPGDVHPDRNFADLGLDSADSIIICGAFEERFDIEVDATLFLRNSNIIELVEDLRRSGRLA